MKLNHLVLTEPNFKAPNWKLGLEGARIIETTEENREQLPDVSRESVVWILSSATDWETLVRHYSARCPVIVLSKLTHLSEMKRALEAGARGYMEALASPLQLGQAAGAVSQGALWISESVLGRLLGILSDAMPEPGEPADWREKLTKRERDVAQVVATGASNREVAEQLHITVRTVKEHLTSIFTKLGIHDRLRLILLAREGGQSPNGHG